LVVVLSADGASLRVRMGTGGIAKLGEIKPYSTLFGALKVADEVKVTVGPRPSRDV
jgi:hypothetical protein